MEETVPEEHRVAIQSHGVSEFYMKNEGSNSGEMVMVSYRPTPSN